MRLQEVLRHGALHNPDSYFVQSPGTHGKEPFSLTYLEAYECGLSHSTWLGAFIKSLFRDESQCSSTFLAPGKDKIKSVLVAYLVSNSVDAILSLFSLGTVNSKSCEFVPAMLNTRWTPQEMASSLQLEEANNGHEHVNNFTFLLHSTEFEEKAKEVVSILAQFKKTSSSICCVPLPLFAQQCQSLKVNDPIRSSSKSSENRLQILDNDDTTAETDDAVILFTSGTSGGAKGVRLSHRALVVQSMAKLLPTCCGYDHHTNLLASAVPLFHVGGLSSFLAVIMAGGCLTFVSHNNTATPSVSSFHPPNVWNAIAGENLNEKVNTLVVVPAMLYALLRQKPSMEKDRDKNPKFPHVRLVLVGGQSLLRDEYERATAYFPRARFVQTYACTEAASSLTFCDLTSDHPSWKNDGENAPSTSLDGDYVGIPPPHIELRIFVDDPEGKRKRRARPFQPGIIGTRGPHVMSGYWKRDRGTNRKTEVQNIQGWFLTTDLGYMDDRGGLFFCGRVKDVIRTGGETVWATQVERVLNQNKEILESAVFSLPDPKFGEAVCAALVLSPESPWKNIETNSIELRRLVRDACAVSLASYKLPQRVFATKQLPRNSSGKLVKYKLVEQFRTRQKSAAIQSKL